MLTLIKREIYDHIAYFLAAVILAAAMIFVICFSVFAIDPEDTPMFLFGLLTPGIVIFLFGSTGMGVSQMHLDRNWKISAFITTLPATRSQIFIARVIAGLLAILLFFIPLIIANIILYGFFVSPVPVYKEIIFDIFTVSFLITLSSYFIGLQTGWTTKRVIPSLAGLFLTCVLVTLVIIKGFNNYISFLLVLFIIASIIRVHQKFISASL